MKNFTYKKSYLFIGMLLLLAGCAAGNAQFTPEQPAGFWYGLWHGVISFISLVIHIFNPDVMVYELDNRGGWYDFGFLLGVVMIWGHGSRVTVKSKAQKKREKEWEEVGEQVEQKIMRKIREWAEKE